jgi:dipeptidyl aminopeptidase/acylaminoacyl peptidase
MRFNLLCIVTCAALGAAEKIPVNLKVEGVPPIPTALMESLSRYNESRPAVFWGWHPARRELLIGTRFGDTQQVHHVKQPGGARRQLTFFTERVLSASYRPGNGDSILFQKDIGGGEFYQYFLYDTRTGESTLVTDGKSRNNFAAWSADGGLLVYSSTRRNGSDTDIYVSNPSDPKSTQLVLEVSGGGWSAAAWSPDGRQLLIEDRKSAVETAYYLFDRETRQKRLLTPRKANYQHAQFSADGKSLYLATDLDAEFLRLSLLDLATGAIVTLRPNIEWDVEGLEVSPDGKRLAYVVNEDGAERILVMDTASRREIPMPKIDYGTIGAIRWRAGSREIGYALSSARSPSDVYSIDVETKAVERWTESETGGLNAREFSEPKLIRWQSFDARFISGFLYMPPKKFVGKRPVIINIHGGPEGQSQPGFIGRNNYFINELGVAMIYPNVRGSTGYGKSFLNLDNGRKREDSVKDIGALLDWIGRNEELDAKRVLVMGGSYGGYMTLASMVHYNDRLAGGIDVVGISNWVTFLERTEAYRRDLRRVEYGDEREADMREFLERISPANHAASITKPMLIVQGRNDPRVNYQESEQMVQAVRKNGGPVWYILAADEGHGFSKKPNQDYQFAASVEFVTRFLGK